MMWTELPRGKNMVLVFRKQALRCADKEPSIVSTRILGRRTAPVAPFRIPHPRPTWFCG